MPYDVRTRTEVYLTPEQEFKTFTYSAPDQVTVTYVQRHGDDSHVTGYAYRTFKNGNRTHSTHQVKLDLNQLPEGLRVALEEASSRG